MYLLRNINHIELVANIKRLKKSTAKKTSGFFLYRRNVFNLIFKYSRYISYGNQNSTCWSSLGLSYELSTSPIRCEFNNFKSTISKTFAMSTIWSHIVWKRHTSIMLYKATSLEHAICSTIGITVNNKFTISFRCIGYLYSIVLFLKTKCHWKHVRRGISNIEIITVYFILDHKPIVSAVYIYGLVLCSNDVWYCRNRL